METLCYYFNQEQKVPIIATLEVILTQSSLEVRLPKTEPSIKTEPFISIDGALELLPGVTRGHLAQMRYEGTGPRFYKPTGRTVFYRASDILAWLESSVRTSTAEAR
jgi:hypothetical protein